MILLAAIDWHSMMFFLFALVACGFAAAVLATSNVVRMAFYLTICLGATAGLFFLAGAEFLGAMQLMIYVGGTLVLLIFGVMLTAQDRFISMKTGAGEWILGAIVGASLFLLLLRAGFSVESWSQPRADRATVALAESRTSTPIGLALSGVRVDKLDVQNERRQAGMSGYLLPFVIISMHLLVVLIGAGYMARTKRARTGLVLERPVTSVIPLDRRRPFLVSAGLIKGMIINFLLMIGCFALISRTVPPLAVAEGTQPSSFTAAINNGVSAFNASLAAAPNWLLPTLGLLFLANVLLLVVVYFWQKWGAVALVLVSLAIGVCLANGNMHPAVTAVVLVLTLGPAVILIVLMTTGKQPTMLSQME